LIGLPIAINLWRFVFFMLYSIYLPLAERLAVLAEFTNACFVGAPFAPTGLIFSPEPAAMRLRLA
jgi:hypothetical protein